MPIYNRGGASRLRTAVAARIGCGYILPRVSTNATQIGVDNAIWLWCNLRPQFVCHISSRQITNRQPHIILLQKNVWMYTNLLWKNVNMCVNIHMKNVNGFDFDTNINSDMCMKVMFIFIDIRLRIAYKYIYLYHAYCHLHHLCVWWCRCICIWICKCICRWIC